MLTAYQKVYNIMQRNEIMRSKDLEEIKKAFTKLNDESSSSTPFTFMGDDVINVSKEKTVRWINAFYNDDTEFLKMFADNITTHNLFFENDYLNLSELFPYIVMSIISHEHTDTIKFILSEYSAFQCMNIRPLYYAALCSENIPIIKHLQNTFDDEIDIYMLEGLIQNNKFEILDVLFCDEDHIKNSFIINSVIKYAFAFNNLKVLDIIEMLAKKYMHDYDEYASSKLAVSTFIQRNANTDELIFHIYDSIYQSVLKNENISTDVLDYLVDMNINAVDISQIIRLCAIMKYTKFNINIVFDDLIDYTTKFISPDSHINCSYMVKHHTYQSDINDGLIFILNTLYKNCNIKPRLILNGFSPTSIYDFKISELRILLKYCIPETDNIISKDSIINLIIEKDKYTILQDFVKGYKFTDSEVEYMIEMCVNLKKMKCLNVLRKHYK